MGEESTQASVADWGPTFLEAAHHVATTLGKHGRVPLPFLPLDERIMDIGRRLQANLVEPGAKLSLAGLLEEAIAAFPAKARIALVRKVDTPFPHVVLRNTRPRGAAGATRAADDARPEASPRRTPLSVAGSAERQNGAAKLASRAAMTPSDPRPWREPTEREAVPPSRGRTSRSRSLDVPGRRSGGARGSKEMSREQRAATEQRRAQPERQEEGSHGSPSERSSSSRRAGGDLRPKSKAALKRLPPQKTCEIAGATVAVVCSRVPVIALTNDSIFDRNATFLFRHAVGSSRKLECLFEDCTFSPLKAQVIAECMQRRLAVSEDAVWVAQVAARKECRAVGLTGERSVMIALVVSMGIRSGGAYKTCLSQLAELGLDQPFERLVEAAAALTDSGKP